MDKRSWPWKKKSSEQATSDIGRNQLDKGKQDTNNENPKYVQISIESYNHLTGLEDQVKSYEEQVQTLEEEVNELHEKLSEAHSEMNDKDNAVKQHAKVAEEAVSGWEKAESEAAMLKNQVESVTLLKLTAEDKASHLDGALKECMRQIRNLKEEHDKNMHALVLNKTKIFEKMKHELEAQISNLERDLHHSAAENAALSRSLHERSNMLIKLSEEKSQAEAEIEYLKSNIESREKEINSLKYELHIATKEMEIRNEEKNMSVRSAEVANKQHLEGVKKIAKLEAECQRLRGLVRKKLPGPAALAQMKLEVENLGRDYGESRLRRSPRSPMHEFSLDNSLKYHKENELLTERLLAMDEQTRMLQEALVNRNSELQASRSLYAQTESKLQVLEAHLQASAEIRRHPVNLTSMSENGNDDNVSCAGSLVSISQKSENASRMVLMDDFLEMEKLAYLSNGSNGAASSSAASGKTGNTGSELVKHEDDAKMITSSNEISLSGDANSCIDTVQSNDQALEKAISCIYDFVMILGKEAKAVPETFSAKYGEAINSEINLVDFVLDVSHILSKASSLHFNVLQVETSSSDCIDKIALPENKSLVDDSSVVNYPNKCSNFSDSSSNPDVPSDGSLVPTSDSTSTSWKCSVEEFEQLKMHKDNLAIDLARCTENFESTKSQLVETEELLAGVKSQLIAAQKSNSLAETQLKCMAESYRALETRAEELQTEVNFLQGKIENLDNQLQEERINHQNALSRCNDLVEQLQRIDNLATADNNDETSQEKELTAAAEKLAECQETIFLLGKQLKALRPQTDFITSPNNVRTQKNEASIDEQEPTMSGINYIDPSEMNLLNDPSSPSESDTYKPLGSPVRSMVSNHWPTKSSSSSASSTPTPEKQARGFSRFFSSKGKNLPVH